MQKDAKQNSNELPQSKAAYVPISVLHHHTAFAMVYLSVPWQAMVYEKCTMKFSFDLRWFCGTLELISTYAKIAVIGDNDKTQPNILA